MYKREQNKKGLTGEISYSLITRTPLFIPSIETVTEDEREHKTYQFISDEIKIESGEKKEVGSPIIPGSEIRGMFRSYFEILSNSCMSSLDSDTQLSKRTSEVFKPGLLKREDEEFVLYEAEVLRYMPYSEYKNTGNKEEQNQKNKENEQEVDETKIEDKEDNREDAIQIECTQIYFEKRKLEKIDHKGKLHTSYMANAVPVGKETKNSGYLLIGNQGGGTKKWSHIIALKNGIETQVEGTECVDISMLEKILKEYKNNTNAYDNYTAAFQRFKDGNGTIYFPVYYSIIKAKNNVLDEREPEEKTMLFLSPAAITREMYQNTIGDCASSYKTCEKEENCCPACALFGMVGKSGEAIASRLRFSDLHWEKKKGNSPYIPGKVTLKELSSPKLNNMEFYLKRPDDAWFWTYDYYIGSNGKLYWHTPELNGRKFYWHAPQAAEPKEKENITERFQHKDSLRNMYEASIDPKTKQRENKRNITAQLLERDNMFHGTLYFKNISAKELKQLIWLLNAGEYASITDKQYGYKLGAGKPLGLGSVAVCVDAVKIRKVEKTNEEITISYKTLTAEQEREFVMPDETCFIQNETRYHAEHTILNFRKATDFLAVQYANKIVETDGSQNTKKQDSKYELSYPYVTEKTEEGYKWFVSNHKAYGLNKKTGENEIKKSPNARKQMVFMNYLEALKPEVQETAKELSAMLENRNKGNYETYGTRGNHSTNRRYENDSKHGSNQKYNYNQGNRRKKQ